MKSDSDSSEVLIWQSPEYVDSWLTDRVRQTDYRRLRQKLVSLLPFEPGAIIRVLDVGAGDGALSLEVLAVYPKAQLVCHDFSETMLARVRQRLAQFSERMAFVKSDLRDPSWTHAIEGTFDAVVSSIAIHNVAEPAQGAPNRIREIYSEVFNLVKPGGGFLNYDHVAPAGPLVQGIYLKEQLTIYQTTLKANMGIEKSLPELERELQAQRRNRSRPSPEQAGRRSLDARTIWNQLEWLKQAGFDEVDCLWKEARSTIIGGFRH